MSVLSPGRNVVLIGLMGSGKSSVGRLVARALGRPFTDTDDLVADEAGKTINEIFSEEGEPAFRRREAEVVRHVSALRGQVIAVGGGAVLDPANVTALRATGDLVWLDAPPSELAVRLGADHTRPLLAEAADAADIPAPSREERLEALHAERAEAYRRAAAHRIDTTGLAPEQIAEEVLGWARTRPGLLSREERRT